MDARQKTTNQFLPARGSSSYSPTAPATGPAPEPGVGAAGFCPAGAHREKVGRPPGVRYLPDPSGPGQVWAGEERPAGPSLAVPEEPVVWQGFPSRRKWDGMPGGSAPTVPRGGRRTKPWLENVESRHDPAEFMDLVRTHGNHRQAQSSAHVAGNRHGRFDRDRIAVQFHEGAQ